MRIIAGEFRGRKLDAPKGDGTRPTTDRVRESLMSALVSLRDGLDGAVVLDAFAGSGALSLEALSRGADTAVLCERDRDAAAVIERNITTLQGHRGHRSIPQGHAQAGIRRGRHLPLRDPGGKGELDRVGVHRFGLVEAGHLVVSVVNCATSAS